MSESKKLIQFIEDNKDISLKEMSPKELLMVHEFSNELKDKFEEEWDQLHRQAALNLETLIQEKYGPVEISMRRASEDSIFESGWVLVVSSFGGSIYLNYNKCGELWFSFGSKDYPIEKFEEVIDNYLVELRNSTIKELLNHSERQEKIKEKLNAIEQSLLNRRIT